MVMCGDCCRCDVVVKCCDVVVRCRDVVSMGRVLCQDVRRLIDIRFA